MKANQNRASISIIAIIWSLYIPSFMPKVVIIVGIMLLRVPVNIGSADVQIILKNFCSSSCRHVATHEHPPTEW